MRRLYSRVLVYSLLLRPPLPVAAMKFNENLQELWLGANHLGPEDGQHLGSILRSNHTLRVLDVRENSLQVMPPFLRARSA